MLIGPMTPMELVNNPGLSLIYGDNVDYRATITYTCNDCYSSPNLAVTAVGKTGTESFTLGFPINLWGTSIGLGSVITHKSISIQHDGGMRVTGDKNLNRTVTLLSVFGHTGTVGIGGTEQLVNLTTDHTVSCSVSE